MAISEFTGSDVLLVIGAVGAAAAGVFGSWLAARRRPELELADDLADMRAYVDKTFVPRSEYQHEIQLMHDARSDLRQEMQRSQSNQAKTFREDLRELRQRLDDWVGRTRGSES